MEKEGSSSILLPEAAEKRSIVRGFLYQPISELPEDPELSDIFFVKLLMAFKTGQQNYGQVMPIGGGRKEKETYKEALMRESLEETHTRPSNLEEIGRQAYFFKHKETDEVRRNITRLFAGDILASDMPYVLDPKEDKMEFAYFDLDKFIYFLNPKEESADIDEEVNRRKMIVVDFLNLNRAQRERNEVIINDHSVRDICKRIVLNFKFKETQFKKKIILKLLDLLSSKSKIAEDDVETITSYIAEENNFDKITFQYQKLIYDFGIDREMLQKALDLANLEQEVTSLDEMEQISWLMAPQVLRNWRRLTRQKIEIIFKCPQFAQLYQGFEALADFLSAELSLPTDWSLCRKLESLAILPDTPETEVKLLQILKKHFGIARKGTRNTDENYDISKQLDREHYYEAENTVNGFIEKMVADSLESRIGESHSINLFGQNNAVSCANSPLELLQLALGVGRTIRTYKEHDPENLHRVQFEASRKLMLMRFASQALNKCKKLSSLPRHHIENIFGEMYCGSKTFIKYDLKDRFDRIMNVCYFDELKSELETYLAAERLGEVSIKREKIEFQVKIYQVFEGQTCVYEGFVDDKFYKDVLKQSKKGKYTIKESNYEYHNYVYRIYDQEGNLFDICLTSDLANTDFKEILNKGMITLSQKEESFRFLKLKNRIVPAFIHSRIAKSKSGIMRKMGIRNCKVEEIHDDYGRVVALEEASQRKSCFLDVYDFEADGKVSVQSRRRKFNDYEVIFDFMDEIKRIVGRNFKIVDFESTPKEGQRIVSGGPGGKADLKFAKFYLCYERENGDEMFEEIIVFVPSTEMSAYGNYVKKVQDDKRYGVERFFSTSGSKDLIQMLCPVYIYGYPIMQVRKKQTEEDFETYLRSRKKV